MSDNLAYQEARREERIRGKVVMMAPASVNHTFTSGNIYYIFAHYLRGKKCIPIADGSTVYLTDEDHFVPDMMVVCDPDKIKHDGIHGAPDLVVEVLSPSTAKNDKTHKKEVYAKCGVQEYWIVNPVDKSVEVYHTNGAEFVLHEIYALRPDWELSKMTEAERAAVVTHFKCSLYDDLDIALEDIFYRTF